MKDAAKRLDFERAAELRDRLRGLRKRDLSVRDVTRRPRDPASSGAGGRDQRMTRGDTCASRPRHQDARQP